MAAQFFGRRKDLGNFSFNSGTNSITLDGLGSSGGSVIVADAVKFPLTSPSQDPAEMRLAIIVVFDDINDTTAIQNWVDEIADLNLPQQVRFHLSQ